MFEELKERGYIYQSTNEDIIKDLINNQKITFYLGIDPTADSLHIGHFFALTLVRRLQKMGHHPIIVVGGATALVGDPSGRSDMRKMLTKEQVDHNKTEVKELVKRFVNIEGDNPAIVLDNNDWIKSESYIDFMRNIGIHFNVNKMLATDCYKKRLEEGGLTFLEMGYMLMQAYDFVYLNDNYSCKIQVGGSDQWANMLAGADLARKIDFYEGKKDRELHTFTCPLLVKADGEKMGKTSSGTLWVSRDKTTVYDFYQMFLNSYDEDVERLLAFFSDFDMNYIREICKSDIRLAKKIMAYEVTKLVHGEEDAKKVEVTSKEVFSGNDSSNMPSIKLDDNNINILDLLVKTNLVPSKSEARRLIEQGGISIDNQKVDSVDQMINEKEFIVQKGKKIYLKVFLK